MITQKLLMSNFQRIRVVFLADIYSITPLEFTVKFLSFTFREGDYKSSFTPATSLNILCK